MKKEDSDHVINLVHIKCQQISYASNLKNCETTQILN